MYKNIIHREIFSIILEDISFFDKQQSKYAKVLGMVYDNVGYVHKQLE